MKVLSNPASSLKDSWLMPMHRGPNLFQGDTDSCHITRVTEERMVENFTNMSPPTCGLLSQLSRRWWGVVEKQTNQQL